jgi:hypothetical protein
MAAMIGPYCHRIQTVLSLIRMQNTNDDDDYNNEQKTGTPTYLSRYVNMKI